MSTTIDKSLENITEQREQMRCVVDENGNVIFASPALIWNLGKNSDEVISSPLNKIISVISTTIDTTSNISDIESGFYEIAMHRTGRDPLVVNSRIDNIKLPDGRSYTVLWLDTEYDTSMLEEYENNGTYKDSAYELADIASRLRFASKVSPSQQNSDLGSVTNVDNISKDDGELRHFLNLSNDLLAVYRRDGSFVRVNYSFNRVLGYTDEDLRQIPFIDLVHPEDREFVCVEMNKLTVVKENEEKRIDFQCRARCKDGGYRWIEWIQKSVGGHIYIIGSDITDLKQHEAELQYREKQLSEAQKIGRMGHWYWVVRDNHIDWSDNLFNIFGVKKGEFEPNIENLRSLMGNEDSHKIIKFFRHSIVKAVDCGLEFSIRVPNTGELKYIRCEGRCKIEKSTGKVKALFGIMQDITEIKNHEKALREAKEAAETAYASKTRFLANMSHELRTPLNAIIGFSEMIQQQLLGPIGNERYLDYIGGIRESGEHLLNLINDILDMSKIEVGKYDLELETFNLSKLAQLAVHMVETRAHESGVKLIADKLPDSLDINADRRAVMQVLLNLLSNAVKFTPEGGKVEISCKLHRENVIITVEDTGVGIPKDKIELVTLPFEQVSSAMTRGHEGSGLGLAITKDLVELHKGSIEIESEVNSGTKVTVIIPQNIQS